MDHSEITENELITLHGLVTNRAEWEIVKKLCRRQIALFWDAVRTTDPADEKRVAANHKLAVGLEASLGNFVKEMESLAEIHNRQQMRSEGPEILDDQTKQLYQA